MALREIYHKSTGPKEDKALEGLTLKEALKTINFWFMGIAALLVGLTMPSMQAVSTQFFSDKGYDLVFIGTVMGFVAISLTLSNIIMGLINKKFGIHVCNIIGFSLFGIAGIMFIYIQTNLMLWIGAICLGLGLSMSSYPLPIMNEKIFGNKEFGSIMGVMTGLMFMGFAAGTPVGNFIFRKYG